MNKKNYDIKSLKAMTNYQLSKVWEEILSNAERFSKDFISAVILEAISRI